MGWEWSGDPPEGTGVIRRPSQWAGSGREALPEGREQLGGPPKGPEWPAGPIGGREWSGCPPGWPEVVGRPSQRTGSDR